MSLFKTEKLIEGALLLYGLCVLLLRSSLRQCDDFLKLRGCRRLNENEGRSDNWVILRTRDVSELSMCAQGKQSMTMSTGMTQESRIIPFAGVQFQRASREFHSSSQFNNEYSNCRLISQNCVSVVLLKH